jgi:hypothetical protein
MCDIGRALPSLSAAVAAAAAMPSSARPHLSSTPRARTGRGAKLVAAAKIKLRNGGPPVVEPAELVVAPAVRVVGASGGKLKARVAAGYLRKHAMPPSTWTRTYRVENVGSLGALELGGRMCGANTIASVLLHNALASGTAIRVLLERPRAGSARVFDLYNPAHHAAMAPEIQEALIDTADTASADACERGGVVRVRVLHYHSAHSQRARGEYPCVPPGVRAHALHPLVVGAMMVQLERAHGAAGAWDRLSSPSGVDEVLTPRYILPRVGDDCLEPSLVAFGAASEE